MRRVICVICLLVMVCVSGCATYWYQPSKTLNQCYQDAKECMYDANKHAFPVGATTLYLQCMKVRGYRALTKDQLPTGFALKIHQVDDIGQVFATGR